MGSGDSSLTHDEVEKKILTLQKEIKDMQSGVSSRRDYPKKVRELMYWRTRQTQLGGKDENSKR